MKYKAGSKLKWYYNATNFFVIGNVISIIDDNVIIKWSDKPTALCYGAGSVDYWIESGIIIVQSNVDDSNLVCKKLLK